MTQSPVLFTCLLGLLGVWPCLIAHFYYLKAGRGIHYLYYYASLLVFLVGQVVLNFFSVSHLWWGVILLFLGALSYITLLSLLYRSMMSIRK